MKLLQILKSLPYRLLLYIFLGLCALGALHMIERKFASNEQQEYSRLLNGNLTAKEKLLEQANNNLGISASKLVTQQNLNSSLAAENKKMKDFISKNHLVAQSQDNAVVDIKSTVVNCPDMKLKITGTVRKQSNGLLETEELTVNAIDEKGNVIPGKAVVLSNDFRYVDAPVALSFWARFGVNANIMAGQDLFMSTIGLQYSLNQNWAIGPQVGIVLDKSGLTSIYGASLVWHMFQ